MVLIVNSYKSLIIKKFFKKKKPRNFISMISPTNIEKEKKVEDWWSTINNGCPRSNKEVRSSNTRELR